MNSIAENLPQIISAAAESYLGILALLSIALSVLAYFFFSTASEKVKVGIFLLLFLGVFGFGVAMFWAPKPENPKPATISGPNQDNPYPPPNDAHYSSSNDEVLLALHKAGVDASIEEETLKEWLNNSSTWYPAISTELLKLLKGKKLSHPVYLDVIVYNYEKATVSSSTGSTDTVDMDRLKTAVVKSYNTRHGEAVTDFEKLLK